MVSLEKYGFSLIRSRELKELDAVLYEMEHIKSGAGLIYLDREDENKTFCIGFPTPPFDDSGVFHIIEHSVLCGSEKFPLRDPFAELLKGSLNTFLNAITYEDRTVYPVSSRCEKDFLNLVDVYMDAVLAPKLLTNPAIFRQEGWHYEYDEEEESLSYSGVVYSEMKGAYSSPDELGGVALNRALWKDEIYCRDSGGNPEFIPTLDYKTFRETYEKYYHPSSAKIILDGKMDLDKLLPLIDSHLLAFDRREKTILQDSYTARIAGPITISYEISENEDESGRARLLYGFVCSAFDDHKSQLAVSLLCDLLCGSNASPLKAALLERKLAKDAAMYSIKSRRQTLILEIRDFDKEKLAEIEQTVKEVITRLATDGIDKEKLTATLNSIEFRLRERDFGSLPLGIAFATSMIGDWLYGGAPEDGLLVNEAILGVREMIEDGYFDKAILDLTLNNPHRGSVLMLPDKSLGEKNAKREREKLDEILNGMNKVEIESIKADLRALEAWQTEEESDEAKATLPSLSIADIRSKPARPKIKEREINGAKILDFDIKTNGIVYISLYFNASDLCEDELVKLSILSSTLINSPTEIRDALSLQNDIKTNLGSLFASFAASEKKGVVTPYLKIGASALATKSEDMLRLINEVALHSKIENERELQSLVLQIKSGLEDAIISSGESIALSRVEASVSEIGAVNEYLAGYEAYRLISELSEDEEKIKKLLLELPKLLSRLVCRERMIVTIAGDAPEGFVDRLVEFIPSNSEKIDKKPTLPCAEAEEYIIVPSKVAYAVSGGRSDEIRENLGLMRVVRSILSYEYLWSTVRMRNGAYGTGFVPRRDGSLAFYSYRDPNPGASLEFYKQSCDYLRSLADSGEDITKFIIGAIGEYDVLTTPRMAVMLATRDYLGGWSEDDEAKVMRGMLSTKTEDLRLAADIIQKVLENQSVSIVGGKDQLATLGFEPKKIIKI